MALNFAQVKNCKCNPCHECHLLQWSNNLTQIKASEIIVKEFEDGLSRLNLFKKPFCKTCQNGRGLDGPKGQFSFSLYFYTSFSICLPIIRFLSVYLYLYLSTYNLFSIVLPISNFLPIYLFLSVYLYLYLSLLIILFHLSTYISYSLSLLFLSIRISLYQP